MEVETTGDEVVHVTAIGEAAIGVSVVHPFFGTISSIKLTHGQALALRDALEDVRDVTF